MLEKIRYVNHLNECIEFGSDSVFINQNDLHSFSWDINKKNNRISSFTKGVVTKTIPVLIAAKNSTGGIKKRNELFEICEKDVLAMKHGKIIIGDYYLKCFVTASQKSEYLKSKQLMSISLKITTDFPYWIKETTTNFNRTTRNTITKIVENTTSNIHTLQLVEEGKYKFFVEVKDSTGKEVRSKAVCVTSVEKLELAATIKSDISRAKVGDNVTLTGTASGGDGGYTYSFLMQNKDTGGWYRFSDFNAKNTLVWKAESVGNRDFYVETKDSTGTIVRSNAVNVSVAEELALDVIAEGDKTLVEVNGNITLTGTASGGDGNYTYRFVVKNLINNTFFTLKDYGTENVYTSRISSAGSKAFYIDVKDGTGAEVRSNAIYVTAVEKLELAIDAESNATKVIKGSNITITGIASGGSGSYTYNFLMQKATDLDFNNDFSYDYTTNVLNDKLINSGFAPENFKLEIYGGAATPSVTIAGHEYKVNIVISKGEYITIDSINKTVILTKLNGTTVNCFNLRSRDSYIFEKIPVGESSVSLNGSFSFNITLFDERSEPKWI